MTYLTERSNQELDYKNQKLMKIVSNFLQNFLSDHTRSAYAIDFRSFAKSLEERGRILNGPEDVTRNDAIEFRNFLKDIYAPKTIHRKLSSLSSLFKELQNAQIIELNPFIGVKRPKAINVKNPKGFSDEEVKMICNYYSEDKILDLNKKAILIFLCYTGCRVTEAVNAKVKDISQDDGIYTILISGKGAKIRRIPLHPKVYRVLSSLIERREKEPGDYIFTAVFKKSKSGMRRESIYRLLKRTLIELGLNPNRSLHSFRRTVISNLLENGHRIESVAEISGHSDINTTKGYLVRGEKLEDSPLLTLNY